MIALLATFASIPKPVKIALAAIAAALFLWGAFTLYVNHRENAAVEADRNKAALEAANTAIRSERAATVNQEARDEANRTADDATRKDITDEARENPEAARAPAGPVTRRAIDSLRNRTTANDTAAR